MRTPIFTGVCPALVTPFHKSGSIDFDSFAKLIEHQVTSGVDAVCVCGTTGESATLTMNEHEQLIEFCVKQVRGRVKVLAGTGSNSTDIAVEKSIHAQELGADGFLVVSPYYNKTTQSGLIAHYAEIAKHTNRPIILYNVPGRTGVSFTAETYQILSGIPNINGVKEASGNISLVMHTKSCCPNDFYIWSGNDDQVVPLMALGAVGVISVASNIIPEIMVHLCRLCSSGNIPDAAKLQLEYTRLIDTLFIEVNPIPVKAAMELLGMCLGHLRLPLCQPTSDHLDQIKKELIRMNLL